VSVTSTTRVEVTDDAGIITALNAGALRLLTSLGGEPPGRPPAVAQRAGSWRQSGSAESCC